MRCALIFVVCLLAAPSTYGQVSNDKVADRIHLVPDALPLHTTTAASTVEWDCLNEALTGKCLVYHNDQWYSFQVTEPQSYFLNISNLVCANTNGIQVIFIEGNPCETKDYRVLQCIRQIKNEEVYVPLGIAVADKTYLIEIDGFDGDHCDFDIQISRRPMGMPMSYRDLQQSDAVGAWTLKDSLVDIYWKVPAGWLDQIDQFRMYRMFEQDIFRLERSVPISKNAYGRPADSYHLQDTLTIPGNYLYRVVGYPQSGQPALMTEVRLSYAKKKKPPPVSKTIVIDPEFDQKADYAVRVYESQQLSVIHSLNGIYDPARPVPIKIDVKEFIDKGHRNFMVVLINKYTRESKEYYFRVDARGSVVED